MKIMLIMEMMRLLENIMMSGSFPRFLGWDVLFPFLVDTLYHLFVLKSTVILKMQRETRGEGGGNDCRRRGFEILLII